MKLLVEQEPHFLMRLSRKWNDISFIGGHEMDRDGNKLSRVAYRELLEEVPTFRTLTNLELDPITEQFCYGPIFSPSAKMSVGYELQFFLLRFFSSPRDSLRLLGPRSSNILLHQSILLNPKSYKIADLVQLLNQTYPGGLQAIPCSWPENIKLLFDQDRAAHHEQLYLRLD